RHPGLDRADLAARRFWHRLVAKSRFRRAAKPVTMRDMQLRVRSITYLAEGINGYELVDPRGRDLPRFEAGAHIELRTGGFLRQYSLCNNPAERRRYCIAVQRETGGRGGSRYL